MSGQESVMIRYQRTVVVADRSAVEIYAALDSFLAENADRIVAKVKRLDIDPSRLTIAVDTKYGSATIVCVDGAIRVEGHLNWLASMWSREIDARLEAWTELIFS